MAGFSKEELYAMDLKTLSLTAERAREVQDELLARQLTVLSAAQDPKAAKKLHDSLTKHIPSVQEQADGSDWDRLASKLGRSF